MPCLGNTESAELLLDVPANEAERIFGALAKDGKVEIPIYGNFLGTAIRQGR